VIGTPLHDNAAFDRPLARIAGLPRETTRPVRCHTGSGDDLRASAASSRRLQRLPFLLGTRVWRKRMRAVSTPAHTQSTTYECSFTPYGRTAQPALLSERGFGAGSVSAIEGTTRFTKNCNRAARGFAPGLFDRLASFWTCGCNVDVNVHSARKD